MTLDIPVTIRPDSDLSELLCLDGVDEAELRLVLLGYFKGSSQSSPKVVHYPNAENCAVRVEYRKDGTPQVFAGSTAKRRDVEELRDQVKTDLRADIH